MIEPTDRGEILRLRQRTHDLQSDVQGILRRVETLESWRTSHSKEADRVYEQVATLYSASETAKAVERALRGRQRVELTWLQRVAGIILFVVTVADFLARYHL